MGTTIIAITTLGKANKPNIKKPTTMSYYSTVITICNDVVLMKTRLHTVCFTRSCSQLSHCILDYTMGKHQDSQGQKEKKQRKAWVYMVV